MENEEIEKEPTEVVGEGIPDQNNGEEGVQNEDNDEERNGGDVGGPSGNDVTEHEGVSLGEEDAMDYILIGGETGGAQSEDARLVNFPDETIFDVAIADVAIAEEANTDVAIADEANTDVAIADEANNDVAIADEANTDVAIVDEANTDVDASLEEDGTHVEVDPNAEAARQSSNEILQNRQSFVTLDLIAEAARERGSLLGEDQQSVEGQSQDHQAIHEDEVYYYSETEHQLEEDDEEEEFLETFPSPTGKSEPENLMTDQQSPEPSSSKPLPGREAEYRGPAQSPMLTTPPMTRVSIPYGNLMCDWQTQAPNNDMVLPPLDPRRKPVIRLHEYPYHPASRYLRNPFYTPKTTCVKMCCEPSQWLSTTRFAGPDRKTTRAERHWARYDSLEDRSVPEALARPNPAATVPMRARKWKGMTWMDPPEDNKHWKTYAEKDKAKKDRLKAQKIGYETLVGNLIYYDIPGAKDLNRSWKHFLDPDPMAWGFPYAKGTRERPHLPPPAPYLVHQMKEQLWKWPRNKLISHSTPSVPESGNDAWGKGNSSGNGAVLN